METLFDIMWWFITILSWGVAIATLLAMLSDIFMD